MGRPYQFVEAGLVVLVVAAGFAIRLLYLDARPLWVDEAETSINALTILQKGYPTDVYLGLPIYENTLIWSWPESAEYEFHDVSYSENHLAVYHGWLPLYLIAGSFAFYGVQPDESDGSRTVKHDLSDRKRRTRAARLPAVLFGSAFLLLVFAGGKILYGRDAAWAALIVGAIYPLHIHVARQARYYSPQVALTTACCVTLWLLLTRCRWKDVCLTALAFVLLFHTHILSFCAAAAVAFLIAPWILLRNDLALRKMAVFAAFVAAGTLPWVIVTGFHHHMGRIPGAWNLLQMPADLFRYPPLKAIYILPGMLVTVLAAWVMLSRRRLPPRFTAPVVRLAPLLLFLGVWMACGYALILGFMPAASFATNRMNLVYWGPIFLLAASVCATVARAATTRFPVITATAIMLLLFFGTGHQLDLGSQYSTRTWAADTLIFERLDAMRLDAASRIYAAPNDHLIFSFYAGLPVQSIAPVRKSFLDWYPGDIVYIDTGISTNSGVLAPERIRQEALRYGRTLSPEAAERCSVLLRTRDYRLAMRNTLEPGRPAQLEPLPAFAEKLLAEDHSRSIFSASNLTLITRGFEIRTWSDWRTVLMYRFVNPAARLEACANYAERLRGSEAVLLSFSGTVIYRSKWHPPGAGGGIAFHFVP